VRALLRHVCRGREPFAAAAAAACAPPGRGRAFEGRALVPPGAAAVPSGANDAVSSAAKSVADASSDGTGSLPAGAHLVQALRCFPHARPGAAPFDCCGVLLPGPAAAAAAARSVSVRNAPHAPYADVALYAWLDAVVSHAAAARGQPRFLRFESVLFQTKLYLKAHMGQAGSGGLDAEFKKMVDGMGVTEKARAAEDATMATRVYLVAGPTARVVHPKAKDPQTVPPAAGPGKDEMNLVVHIETNEAGIVAKTPKGDPSRFPALYPLTVGRLTTWVRDDDADAGAGQGAGTPGGP